MTGAVERVRPKMMTVAAIMAGLLPIMWSHGTGAEVMQRIAVPMIGGMVSSTLLTLIVIPAIYAVVKGVATRAPRLAPYVPAILNAELLSGLTTFARGYAARRSARLRARRRRRA